MAFDIQGEFEEAVTKEIASFNAHRGKRKPLIPKLDTVRWEYKKYGWIVEFSDCDLIVLKEAILRAAQRAIRTMLRIKPRPELMALAVAKNDRDNQYRFRIAVPKRPK